MSIQDVAVTTLAGDVALQPSESRVAEPMSNQPASSAAGISIRSSMDDKAAAKTADQHALSAVQSSSSNNSQSSIPDADATTPPTSDAFSQSHTSPSRLSQLSQLSQPAEIPVLLSQPADAARVEASVASNAGQKRTIDGYAKPARRGSSSSGSPPRAGAVGHARIVSSVSAASSSMSSREVWNLLFSRTHHPFAPLHLPVLTYYKRIMCKYNQT
jgi:hypothetical protein